MLQNAQHVSRARRGAGIGVSIPNLISLLRVFLVPLLVWLIIAGRMDAAFGVFLIAGVSDGVDGYLAKRYGWQTELGAYLDPLADKLLLVSVFVTLGLLSELPSWLVVAVVSRDLLIVSAFLLSWVLGLPMRAQPLLVSKANTAVQILLAAVVLADLAFALGLGTVRLGLVWIAGFLTILSAAAYLRSWIRHMAGYETSIAETAAPADESRRARNAESRSDGSEQGARAKTRRRVAPAGPFPGAADKDGARP